jgi:hypothetical protein
MGHGLKDRIAGRMRDHKTKPFLAQPEPKPARSIRLTSVQDLHRLVIVAVFETDERTVPSDRDPRRDGRSTVRRANRGFKRRHRGELAIDDLARDRNRQAARVVAVRCGRVRVNFRCGGKERHRSGCEDRAN